MDVDKKRSASTRALFLAIVIVLGYVVLSVAIAINTVDTCGDESDPKHWSFNPFEDSWQLFPPEWICEDPESTF
jgi:hypothetical protein